MIGYEVVNTLTKNGSVKRGVCYTNNGYLTKIIECSIDYQNNKLVATPLNGGDAFEVVKENLVSMNMLGFDSSIFRYMDNDFKQFIIQNKNNLLNAEWFIPDVLSNNIKNKNICVKVIKTSSKWYGVTYKEDRQKLVNDIKRMVDDGFYLA